MRQYREYNFDGIVGPTHHYGGLSWGNLASIEHTGQLGNPQAAALEGLEKMRFVASLGVGQAVLPPSARPPMNALRQLGYQGTTAQCLRQAYLDSPALLNRLFSAASMWTANAATVFPSSDTLDGRLHLLVANLSAMPHRSLEAADTYRILKRVFASDAHFQVHGPLPGYLGDEGAANQLRLQNSSGAVHLLGWGRSFEQVPKPERYVARQSREASHAAQRLCSIAADKTLLWQQHPLGIDRGAFHSDVLAVSNQQVLLLHEHAFVQTSELLESLAHKLGSMPDYCLASESELSTQEAVKSYPFNSQLVTLPGGGMAILAPAEAELSARARAFLERASAELSAIHKVHYIDVNSSMKNGGGPACLRLRVPLSEGELAQVSARVFFDAELYADLKAWVLKHYRSELASKDFQDPLLVTESYAALDELTQILKLGSVYEFQGATS